jgi:hypothetical protein
MCRVVYPFLLVLSLIFPTTAYCADSLFDFAENQIEASPAEAAQLDLQAGESVADFDVSPLRPLTALVIKTAQGHQKILFWDINNSNAKTNVIWNIPDNIFIQSIVFHPQGNSLFLLTKRENEQQIITTPIDKWLPQSIYRSSVQLRRLVVGPRPFELGYNAETNSTPTAYRLFFGVKNSDGKFSTHSITETGTREYVALGSAPIPASAEFAEFPPNRIDVSSALPVGFHPAGNFLIWQDEKNCFQRASYGLDNWDDSTALAKGKVLCNGSITYSPNGIGLLRWESGLEGVVFHLDRGEKTIQLAKGIRLVSTPSSVADGRGIVAVTKQATTFSVRYIPVDIPLADVVNAWMYLESPQDRELFSAHSGLFRTLEHNQLYELYDSESYHCGDYDQSTPTRPYLVTTDIFWELYAAAYEGIFILAEKQAAVFHFWEFAEQANKHFNATPESKMARAFAAIIAVHNGDTKNAEAMKIIAADGRSRSSVTNKDLDFGNLKPRSHYAADTEMQIYFRASKYLMDLVLDEADIALLTALPAQARQSAQDWINVYSPFIAPSKRPLIWNATAAIPKYVRHPETQPQIFPLSWGIDNEILFTSVFHSELPADEQITGSQGHRLLPSGLDLASVLGSQLAESILTETGEFKKYPPLKQQLENAKKRVNASTSEYQDNIYLQWLSGLAVQWSSNISAPGNTIDKTIWATKRLQTGLASWATLRHATLLVNERVVAECGEGGFEFIVLRPPRGYVEPDPKTFDAIAKLFETTIGLVKTQGKYWKGSTPDDDTALQEGIIRRLGESRDRVLAFRNMAQKEIDGKPLTNQEYEDIRYVARAAEHNFLIFKSLAQKDFALSTPDPIPKVADVASDGNRVLLAGVGTPMEWDQIVPFFGRKQIVKGSTYSYYEIPSPNVMSDSEWRTQLKLMQRPAWIKTFISNDVLSCPAKAP